MYGSSTKRASPSYLGSHMHASRYTFHRITVFVHAHARVFTLEDVRT